MEVTENIGRVKGIVQEGARKGVGSEQKQRETCL